MRTTVRRRHFVDVLFGAYRRNILALLLLQPDESFYVREIARLTDTPAGSLHRELKLLSDAGILLRRTVGNHVRYQANRECPIYEELAAVFRKTTGLADVIREALSSMARRIRLSFVFGSVANGTDRSGSDVDVIVVGKPEFDEVVVALSRSRDRLRREVNPVVMTETQFRNKLVHGDRFVSRIVREPKIFIIGDAGELGKLAPHRPAQASPA